MTRGEAQTRRAVGVWFPGFIFLIFDNSGKCDRMFQVEPTDIRVLGRASDVDDPQATRNRRMFKTGILLPVFQRGTGSVRGRSPSFRESW